MKEKNKDEDRIRDCLHQEYHNAEKKVLKKLKINGLTQNQIAKGVVAYLSCRAIKYFQEYEKEQENKNV